MPPNFCLLPKHVDELKAKLTSGDLDPADLATMSSAERHAAFADVVGDANAGHINAAFESKLLLKNQQQGLQTWIRDVSGAKPAVQRDMLARVGRMTSVLEPKDLHAFMADLAKQKLGVGVTMDEAGKISSLAKAVSDAKTSGKWEDYMDARANFREYVAGLQGHGPMSATKGIVAGIRAGVLSSPPVLVKLTSIALARTVTTPIEDVVALGVSKALPKLAAGSPEFSADLPTAIKAQAAGYAAMFTDGLIDAGRLLQNKASRLDLAHSDDATAHAWYEYAGSIHGALKEPIKRMTYARSLYRRTAEALSRGEDVTDMTVKLRLSTEAYKEGQRSISMQDNKLSGAVNAGLRHLESVNKDTGKPSPGGVVIATALRSDMPVMKAPANSIAEASDYIAGLLTGPAKAAYAYAHGIENLKPVERDLIIREISKGAVGAAVMALYFFKSDAVEFGGYYQKGEKRGPNDVKPDELRVHGVNVPKEFIHHPLFQAAQFAATTARVSGAKQHAGDQDPEGLRSAVWAAAVGLAEQVPVLGSVPKDMGAIVDPNTRDSFMARKAASIAVPGVINWIAKKTDPDTAARKPTGVVEEVKARVPGLRESVPLKSEVDSAKKERQKEARQQKKGNVTL